MSESMIPVRIAVMTVSDTRTLADDRSGAVLIERLQAAGHELVARTIVRDEIGLIRAQLRRWIAEPTVQVVLATGGTGITARDVTPEALAPLISKPIPGFGELFRWLSYAEIGTSTIQSRAEAAICDKTLVFVLPGSPNACKTAWDKILASQLDSRHKPCNFVELFGRL
ncbi:MAG TPA: molybdenum cofactor biosynthesis protein B [Enhygromyxa sp.]|nr:molybdenum cofactor biosynthesis protein B [Enhygromyxa sp.]